jgi:hypothetical protein
MPNRDDTSIPTWTDRRRRLIEGWIAWHLAALAVMRPDDLRDAAALRALATHAAEAAVLAERLRRLSGDEAHVEQLVAAFRAELETL